MIFIQTFEFAFFCILGTIIVALWPPEQGEMVVYYPFASSEAEMLGAVFASDAKLIAKGPINNSWIIWIDHPRTTTQLTQQGGFLLGVGGFHGCAGQQKTRKALENQGYLTSKKI